MVAEITPTKLAPQTPSDRSVDQSRLINHPNAINTVAILSPVYNDWECFASLIEQIARCYPSSQNKFKIVVVDDGSIAPRPSFSIGAHTFANCIESIHVIRLALNLGHQRAIAVGLSYISKQMTVDAVVVMDSDGEDRPEEIQLLLSAALSHPRHIVFAQRGRRTEGRVFRLGYFAYKLLFKLLTGRTITFGNFSLLPSFAVHRLVYMSELWNNLPAAIMRSRLPLIGIPTKRGKRYYGRSKMNLINLILHGLSSLSVYTDMIFARVLLGAGIAGGLTLVGILVTVFVRLFTSMAIPGWATVVVGDLLILQMLIGGFLLAAMLMVLAGRSQRPIVPAIDAISYISETDHWPRQKLDPLADSPAKNRWPQLDPLASVAVRN
jgi:hypothetical protein